MSGAEPEPHTRQTRAQLDHHGEGDIGSHLVREKAAPIPDASAQPQGAPWYLYPSGSVVPQALRKTIHRTAIGRRIHFALLVWCSSQAPSEATVEAAARPATTPEGFMADLAVAKLFETRRHTEEARERKPSGTLSELRA